MSVVCLSKPVAIYADETLSQSLSRFDAPLIFDLGNHLVGESFEASLRVKNDTGVDLKLELNPSCGCTKISKTELSATIGAAFALDLDIKVPDVSQEVGVTIQCLDRTQNISFPILIKYRANPIISYEGTVALVEDSKAIQRLDLNFRIQPGFAIEDFQVSDNFVKLLERREAIDGGVIVTAELDPTMRKDNVDDIVHFSVKLKDHGSDAFRQLSVQVPVRYADRVTVGPSRPTFSLSKKEVRGRIYIVGERAKEIFSKGEIRLSNGESTVRLTVSNLIDRGNKKAWFAELSFDLQDQSIDLEVGDWNLEVVESSTVIWRRRVSFVQD